MASNLAFLVFKLASLRLILGSCSFAYADVRLRADVRVLDV